MAPDLHRLHQIAARQHGIVRRSQLAEAGYGPSWIQRRQAAGELHRVAPRLFRVAGAPETAHQRAWIALLDAGGQAALSHDSAAALWGLPGFDLEPLHVARQRSAPHRRTRRRRLHEPRRLPAHHLTELDGLRVTNPARTVFDLAEWHHLGRVARALDTLCARRLVSAAGLQTMLDEIARRGRPGIRAIRVLLAERGPGYRPPESGLERRFQSIVERAGLTGFHRQVDLGDEQTWLARVDFVDRSRRLAVQIDSDRYHSALLDAEHDRRQDRALEAAGWTVLRFNETDVWHRPRDVVATIRSYRVLATPRAECAPDLPPEPAVDRSGHATRRI